MQVLVSHAQDGEVEEGSAWFAAPPKVLYVKNWFIIVSVVDPKS